MHAQGLFQPSDPLLARSSAVYVKRTAAAAAATSAMFALIAARITLYLTFVCACLINDDASATALATITAFASVLCCFFCLRAPPPLLLLEPHPLSLLPSLSFFVDTYSHCFSPYPCPCPQSLSDTPSCHALPWPYSFILQRSRRLIRAHFTYCQPELRLT